MANISLTNECNRACSYCFAVKTKTNDSEKNSFMTLHLFENILDFIERSGIRQVRLMGGEPTLHPEFSQIIEKVIVRHLDLVVFSNGFLSEAVVQLLEQIPNDQATILINTAIPGESLPEELRRQRNTFRRLGSNIMLGVNIHNRQQEFDFLISLIHKYNLIPKVRLGLAHPAPGETNHFLQPKFYPVIGEKICSFSKSARQNGIEIEFDCGFVHCMFPHDISELTGKNPQDIGQRCNPIPDILPDVNVLSCYPLHGLGEILSPIHHDSKWLQQQFTDRLAPFKQFGIYPQCTICDLFKRGDCLGGCKAITMTRLRCGQSINSINSIKQKKKNIKTPIQN